MIPRKRMEHPHSHQLSGGPKSFFNSFSQIHLYHQQIVLDKSQAHRKQSQCSWPLRGTFSGTSISISVKFGLHTIIRYPYAKCQFYKARREKIASTPHD